MPGEIRAVGEGSGWSIDWADDLRSFAESAFQIPAWWGRKVSERSQKVIHDPIWGTQHWDDWEVAIIDLLAMQRLRDIKQVSFGFLTYPGALHTRFDHSLGVASGCKLFMAQLEARGRGRKIPRIEKAHIVAAALLHDIGHGPYSHVSEECYAFSPDWFQGVLAGAPGDTKVVAGDETALYPKAAPHEALGALLLRTEAAADFFDAVRRRYGAPKLDPLVVGDIIAGNGWPGRDHLAALVNGDLDADKADYVRRDAHYTGLAISLDIGRLGHTLQVIPNPQGDRQLALHASGEAVGNQLLFARTTLTSCLYHHPKVRAADSTFKAIMERAILHGATINGIRIHNPACLLRLTDSDFSSRRFRSDDPDSERLVERLQQRDLLYPAAEVSSRAIIPAADGRKASKLWDLRIEKGVWANQGKVREAREMAKQIIDVAGIRAEHSDVWVDFPYVVRLADLPLTDGRSLADTYASFPGQAWVGQYVKYLYRGYVFCPAEDVAEAASAFQSIAAKQYNTVFDESIARRVSAYRTP